ncbi:hypothetical protein [Vineibacter terrae]|uniref:hypothetical protein n=1 Tax=Vineibacter terrae TaxID=2586908 RepID=UPI002E377184|nr:hypothetical protein [Vineibacter terrae]HEX2885736.1 hypothetical protein [Vineibacter terrae]
MKPAMMVFFPLSLGKGKIVLTKATRVIAPRSSSLSTARALSRDGLIFVTHRFERAGYGFDAHDVPALK